jgi:branched-chain amino acid aminotransferase
MTAWHFFDGDWHDGNPAIMGPMSHGFWMASTVFDGARAFEGVAPDLEWHCRRLNASAAAFGLKAVHSVEEMLGFAAEGLKKFPADAQLYVRPMYWAEAGFVAADPETTRFCLSLHESPLPEPNGFAVTLSPFRRPTLEMAPTNAKAACLYPNSGRALLEAKSRGFDNAVLCDALGNVAELATANIWLGKDGCAHTPVPNGTFLNGITKQRTQNLMEQAGIEVVERTLTWKDFLEADEVFSTGNYGKVMPITRVDDRELQPGPLYRKARKLYWDWAHSASAPA